MKQDRTATEAPCGTPVDRHVRPLPDLRELAQEGAVLHSEEMPERQVCDGLLWALDELERLRAELTRLSADAARWGKFCRRMQYPGNPMRGKWRLVEISPTYGDEKDIDDVQRAVDEA